MGARRHLRMPTRRHRSGEFDQPLDSIPVWSVHLERLRHRRIVEPMAREEQPDTTRQMVVTEADRVTVAVSALAYLGCRPDTDPGQRAKRTIGVRTRHRQRPLERIGALCGSDNRAGPRVIDAQAPPRPGRDGSDRRSRGWHEQLRPARRSGRRIAVLTHEVPPPIPRLSTGDLLLQYRRQECFEHQARSRYAHVCIAPPCPRQRRMARVETGRIIRIAEHRRHAVQGPAGPAPPGTGQDSPIRSIGGHSQGRWSGRRTHGAPDGARTIGIRRITRAPPQPTEDQPSRNGARRVPLPGCAVRSRRFPHTASLMGSNRPTSVT